MDHLNIVGIFQFLVETNMNQSLSGRVYGKKYGGYISMKNNN